MKKLLSLLTLVLLFQVVHAQLVITEISYNPPEAGNDTLEYIEIYNASDSTVDLYGMKITDAFVYTFDTVSIEAGAFVVLCINDTALKTIFPDIVAFKWTSGALSNSGETITLRDSLDNIIDQVTYDDSAPWPTFAQGTAGNGATIVLCDPLSDNSLPTSWRASKDSTGVIINGKEFLGSAGEASVCEIEPAATITANANRTFTPDSITIEVGDLVRFVNGGGHHNVNGSITKFPENPDSFGNGNASDDPWVYDFTFTIPGVYRYVCDPHEFDGMDGVIVVVDPFAPIKYTIPLISSVDENGVADSLGVRCAVEGVVHGINFRPSGLQFTIIDSENNGIGVFSSSNSFGYTYAEGDLIEVVGTVEQFNGLTQIAVTEITVLSGDNSLVEPKPVTEFVEEDESSLLMIEDVDYVDASEWLGDGSNFNVIMTDGTNEFTVRIDADSELSELPAPTGPFNIVGILGQFDNTTPFTEGYQLFPSTIEDFITTVSNLEKSFDDFNLYPNPVQNILNIEVEELIDNVQVFNSLGQLVLSDRSGNNSLDVSDLPPSFYMVKIATAQGIGTKAIIKY